MSSLAQHYSPIWSCVYIICNVTIIILKLNQVQTNEDWNFVTKTWKYHTGNRQKRVKFWNYDSKQPIQALHKVAKVWFENQTAHSFSSFGFFGSKLPKAVVKVVDVIKEALSRLLACINIRLNTNKNISIKIGVCWWIVLETYLCFANVDYMHLNIIQVYAPLVHYEKCGRRFHRCDSKIIWNHVRCNLYLSLQVHCYNEMLIRHFHHSLDTSVSNHSAESLLSLTTHWNQSCTNHALESILQQTSSSGAWSLYCQGRTRVQVDAFVPPLERKLFMLLEKSSTHPSSVLLPDVSHTNSKGTTRKMRSRSTKSCPAS